jgi:hypothetical protein
MKRIVWFAFALFAVLIADRGIAGAQETRATLSGTVTDSSGSAIPSATLTLFNSKTSISVNVRSNGEGQYRFLFVDPGTYTLTAEASGFSKFSETGIILVTSQNSTLDVAMTVGAATQTISVTADQPLLETEKSDRGLTLSERSLEELPINVRNPIALSQITPGVTQSIQRYDLTPFTNNGLSQFAINGIQGDATENLLDGAPNDMIYQGLNSIAYVPSVDMVSQFKTITAPYDAQYGRAGGGVISVVTKNGTNQLHGTAYYFLQRPNFNANAWVNNANGKPKSDNSLDEYGFTIGGPVVLPKLYNGHDKTFFFGGWEGYKQSINLASVTSVPTEAQRNGDFSQTRTSTGALITVYDPSTGRNVNGTWTRDPFPGNIIPGGKIDPVAKAILNLYPLPNQNQSATVNWQNNYYAPSVTTYTFNNAIGRIDHTFSEREKIYVRYAWNSALIQNNQNQIPGVALDDRHGTKTNNDVVIDSVTVLTPNLLLDLRGSLTRWTQNFLPSTYGQFDATQLGMPASQVNQFQEKPRFPYITLTNAPASGFPASGGTAQYQYLGISNQNIYFAPTTAITGSPTVIWTKGRHTIKTGLDWRWTRFASYQGAYGGGAFNATSTFTEKNYLNTTDSSTGNSAASLLLGAAYTGEVDYNPRPFWSIKYYGLWFQDDIKLTSRLTINAGIRYDVQSPITERHNIFNYGFDFGAVNPINSAINHGAYPGTVYGGLGFVNVNGNPRSPFQTDWNNIQPRVGLAYRATDTMVLRGGFGIFYVPQFSQASQNGFAQPTPFVGTTDNGATIASKISNPFPNGVQQPSGSSLGLATLNGKPITFSDTSGQIGHVQSFTVGLQKQLPAHITIDASYVGTRANQLPITLNINAPSAADVALANADTGGNPTYFSASVPNPFAGQLPGTTLNGATVTRQQLLLPFPQFTAVNRADIPIGKNWYNALQVTLQQRTYHGLDITLGYTLQKNLQAMNYQNPQDAGISAPGTSAGNYAAFAVDALRPPTHSLTPYDRTQRLNIAPVYELPFGKGKQYFNRFDNKFVNTLITGWQGSASFIWQTGAPMAAPSGLALIGDPNVSDRNFDHMFNSGVKRLNGTTTGRTASDIASPAWRELPAFAPKPTSQYLGNVRDFWGTETNITASKNNYIHETMNLQLRFDFLNAFNHPIFGQDPVVSPSSPDFGRLVRTSTGQSAIPRTIQLAARFVF